MLTAQQQAAVVILGSIFLFIGLAALALAAARRRGGRSILIWFGIFSAMYGIRLLAEIRAAFGLIAGPFSQNSREIVWLITYFILIPAILFWAELSLGILRRFFQWMAVVACGIAILGTFAIFALRFPTRFMAYNNVLAICLLLALVAVNVVPQLAKKYLLIQSWISAAGTLLLAAAVIHENLRTFLPLRNYPFFEPIALALFVLSQGWVAAEKIFTDERRLISIENELAIAREIQNSILPSAVPKLSRLRISAAYSPMTAVAGDFYWFNAVDPHRAGFLVADVSGHGVPAALIASMIKVAMQSVGPDPSDPGAVLRQLGNTLAGQLRGQFVSAAYLWIDTEDRNARYSAAGHPPLLLWHDGRLERIESNGLLFGILSDHGDYPVRELPISSGERFLLYTDGVTEPENSAGVAFGDGRLEQVVRANQSCPASELSDQLFSEIRRWQSGSEAQQDDMTLIVIDVI